MVCRRVAWRWIPSVARARNSRLSRRSGCSAPNPATSKCAFALLESPRVTGYGFVVRPGPAGQAPAMVINVRARLTLRAGVVRLGIAPLTSMFLAGDIQPATEDYRPEVHDSDGLEVWAGDGEWLWRSSPIRRRCSSPVSPRVRRAASGCSATARYRGGETGAGGAGPASLTTPTRAWRTLPDQRHSTIDTPRPTRFCRWL